MRVERASTWQTFGVSGVVAGVERFEVLDQVIRPELVTVTYDFLPRNSGGNGRWEVSQVAISGPSLNHRDGRQESITWHDGDTAYMNAYLRDFVEDNTPSTGPYTQAMRSTRNGLRRVVGFNG